MFSFLIGLIHFAVVVMPPLFQLQMAFGGTNLPSDPKKIKLGRKIDLPYYTSLEFQYHSIILS